MFSSPSQILCTVFGVNIYYYGVIMALAIASGAAENAIVIDDEKAAAVTFPTFFELAESIRRER